MSAITQRPGVYTSYYVQSAVSGADRGGTAGLAAIAASGSVGTIYEISSYAQAAAAFGEGCNMTKLIRLLLRNGCAKVLAAPAVVSGTAQTSDYTAAFTLLMAREAVSFMVCDSRAAAVHAAMKSAIIDCEREESKYRMGIVEAAGTAAELVSDAAALNCERMVLLSPVETDGTPGAVAAAFAGCAAAATDPALPFNGAELFGLGRLGDNFTDAQVNTLAQGGVTPVETLGGQVCVVRGVTTRTTTSGAADDTWREVNTVMIVDDVIPTVRARLKTMFARAKNTAQTRGAIRTQVMIELERKLRAQTIDSYGPVTAIANGEDPTVCDVSFEFTVAHGLNKIDLVAYITV